ncbi:hypothetical protein F5Y13DRAFT_172277 [Hypoxylon sp. FL1857]|nr:hypothetical protein F5Y13DRAFT_172277 [Hypoxylon sp. FL1857]
MGNSLSAEAPWRGQRTSQKLSKPKTGNPTAAGLLSSTGVSNSARPFQSARRLSLPHASSPTASPMLPEAVPPIPASVPSEKKGLELGSRISRRLFRSNTSKEFPSRRQRSSSVEVSSPQQEHWSHTASSLRNGPEDGYNYGQPHIQASLSMNTSRTSFNYDLGSYEAQRLLNLVEEPSYEDNSVVSENQMHISEAMRSDLRNRRPSLPETAPAMTRVGSEVSLYTPMRRRSLMTPGIATREVPQDPVPSIPKTRYSLPPTPARRQSVEAMGIDPITFPPLPLDLEPVPRVLTPCEADYKQTGAFKHGTLRITNGSPARSPVRSPVRSPARAPSDAIKPEGIEDLSLKGDSFATENLDPSNNVEINLSSIGVEKAEVQSTNSSLSPLGGAAPDIEVSPYSLEPQTYPQLPPEPQISAPRPNDDTLKIPEIQVTSKHTAVEDALFDDEQNEFSSVEVLDVRVDTNAKSLPARPKLTLGERSSREISRSDSGIASPASEYSHAPLSKADSGYSSSVSIRSLSSKLPAPEKDRTSDIEVDVMNDANRKSLRSEEPEVTSPAVTAVNIVNYESFQETSPPPVPMKDPHLLALASPKGSGELSPSRQQSPKLPSPPKYKQVPERILSPNSARSHVSRVIETHRASSLSPTGSNSPLSISTGFRKPGKLQRFLSGNRAPLTVHNTHPNKRLALKSAASRETLGTILSVGSAELLQDDDVPPKSSGGKLRAQDRNQGTSVSIGSPITPTSYTFTKKPIPRKPVPIRSKDPGITEGPAKPRLLFGGNEITQATLRGSNERAFGSTKLVMTNDRRHSAPIPRPIRPNTMTSHVEGALKAANASTAISYELVQDKSHSTTSLDLSPVTPNVKLSRSPPPVSMRTRNMGPLRIPPPARSQSTPPESMKRPARSSYSRRGSREGLRTPQLTSAFTSGPTPVSRKSSRESFDNYSSAQPYHYAEQPSGVPVPNMPRPMNLKPENGVRRIPSWNVQVDHGPSLSRRSSSEYSRRSSLASQSSQRSSATTDPSLFRPQYYSNPDLPSLHRRSSYDEYNLMPRESCIRDNGPYPSLSRNGLAVVSDPWSGRSMSMPQQSEQEWDQPIRHPLHPPRRHIRHRSLDQYGNPMPYRVLHSYNSPAYRNVPIWR